MKFPTKVCFFCNAEMKIHIRSREIEYSCIDKFCYTKYYYQTWTDIDGKLQAVMFLCNDKDIEVNYENNETLVLKEKDSRKVLFKLDYVIQPTAEKGYDWLKNKIVKYEILL